jgi:hypothetical protein
VHFSREAGDEGGVVQLQEGREAVEEGERGNNTFSREAGEEGCCIMPYRKGSADRCPRWTSHNIIQASPGYNKGSECPVMVQVRWGRFGGGRGPMS